MRRASIAITGFVAAALIAAPASAQQAIKIGLIMPHSGQFADTAIQARMKTN